MTLKKDILTSIIAVAALTLVLGVVYPLFITGVSQVAFPGNANGQQVHVGGKLVASKIIGQSFADPVINRKTGKPKLDANGNPVTTPDQRYFQTRPSGTVPSDNAAATAFANSARTTSPPSRRSRPTSRPTWHWRSPTTQG